jgi:hypothetical protein
MAAATTWASGDITGVYEQKLTVARYRVTVPLFLRYRAPPTM